MNPNDIFQMIAAVIGSVAGIIFAYQRYSVLRTKELTVQASESAIKSQFQNLRDAIEANRKEASDARTEAQTARTETAELRHEFARMDRIIHVQQRTITRMELLIRQFSKLIQSNNIQVPKYMQDELEDLIIDNETLAQRIQDAMNKVQKDESVSTEYYEFGATEDKPDKPDKINK